MKGIRRTLKTTGSFLIINRCPSPDSRWSDFLQLKNAEDYKENLNNAGFRHTFIDDFSRKKWILVKTEKGDVQAIPTICI